MITIAKQIFHSIFKGVKFSIGILNRHVKFEISMLMNIQTVNMHVRIWMRM